MDDKDRVRPGEDEARAKGEWAQTAVDGIVPAELGGSEAPEDKLDEDPQLTSEALGRTTGDDTPATTDGIDEHAGDRADATTDGGPATRADLKDAATGPRKVDLG
jgi:hypothetical protein